MKDRILLVKKSTYQDHMEVGLFFLPKSKEFVTWLINTKFDDPLNRGTVSGHYFRDIHDALKDFDKRG